MNHGRTIVYHKSTGRGPEFKSLTRDETSELVIPYKVQARISVACSSMHKKRSLSNFPSVHKKRSLSNFPSAHKKHSLSNFPSTRKKHSLSNFPSTHKKA
jgi:hypothetical protein